MTKQESSAEIAGFDVDGADVALLYGADWASGVPSEVRLFRNGVNPTKKGEFIFDETAAEAVMAAFAEQGMDKLPIDIAHGMMNPSAPPDAHKSLGWFTPVVKSDVEGGSEGPALYASDIEWTESGLQALRKREFRFFSPAVNFDPETRRVTRLINFALTNLPATKNQRPLVLDALGDNNNNEENTEMQVLLDTLGASDEAGAVASVSRLQEFETAILSALDVPADKAGEKIAQLSQLAAEAIEARAELQKLRDEVSKAEREARLDGLVKDGQLPPAQREFAALLSDDQLEAFVATLSAVDIKRTIEPAESAPKRREATEAQRAIAAQLGISEEVFTGDDA
jgi:phage I-like protein